MSTATEIIHTPTTATPFDIVRAAFVELRVADLDASHHFYVDLLGMIVSARTEEAIYLRAWEERQHHSLILRRGSPPAASRLGFRVHSSRDLDLLAGHFDTRGLACEWIAAGVDPGMGRRLHIRDPFGYPLEFVDAFDEYEPQHQRFDLHRGAPVLRFDHLNIHSSEVEATLPFWVDLGFRCSEYISTDSGPERITGAWMSRKPTVHDLALTVGTGPRLHHFAYWVTEPAAVLRACDQLAAARRSDAIERGPGRHGVSNAFFVYLRDPDGHRIELYSCDYYTGDPGHKPIRWSVNDPRCRSFWGTRAPNSWYEESSLLVDSRGTVEAVIPADIDERDQHSEVLA